MKETSLSEILLKQMESHADHMNLSEEGPVLSRLPPFLLRPLPETALRESHYHFEEFSSAGELRKKYPQAEIRKAHPHEIYRFLSTAQTYLDFEQLGCVALNNHPLGKEIPMSRMGLWLNYALSPELWGTEGKWTRFHEQLRKVFEEKNLLEGTAVPGYYPLKSDARPWEKYPFTGDRNGNVYTLVLPWTFSLSDLGRLTAFINEEI